MLKPKMMTVLIKGEKFDKLQIKDKKNTKRKLFWLFFLNFFKISTFQIEKQIWKLSSDLRTLHYTDYDNNDIEISCVKLWQTMMLNGQNDAKWEAKNINI